VRLKSSLQLVLVYYQCSPVSCRKLFGFNPPCVVFEFTVLRTVRDSASSKPEHRIQLPSQPCVVVARVFLSTFVLVMRVPMLRRHISRRISIPPVPPIYLYRVTMHIDILI